MSKRCVIRTFTGKEVNPLDLKPEDIDIRDIAHHLACVNRFAGALRHPVSVAQHSVYVSRLVADARLLSMPLLSKEERGALAKKALLHDAAEAYLGDVTKWLKQSDAMRGYREAEDRAEAVIAQRFDLELPLLDEEIDWADRVMVRFEGRKGFGMDFTIDHHRYPPLTDEEVKAVGRWIPWSWQEAEEAFLTRWRCIQNGVM